MKVCQHGGAEGGFAASVQCSQTVKTVQKKKVKSTITYNSTF